MRRLRLLIAALAVAATMVLGACTPEQVMITLASRGDQHAQVTYHRYAHRIPVPASDWQRYVELSRALTAYSNSEAARNSRADYAARNTGARGTCSPTGIFYAESSGVWTAQNPTSTASGGFGYLNSTWSNHRGYLRARDAPPWVQWERFLQTWNGGAGRSHWTESVC